MEIVDLKEKNITFAENQPQYLPLPAHVDDEGTVTACWKLSKLELIKLIFTRKIYIQILTFKSPIQPHKLLVYNPLKRK